LRFCIDVKNPKFAAGKIEHDSTERRNEFAQDNIEMKESIQSVKNGDRDNKGKEINEQKFDQLVSTGCPSFLESPKFIKEIAIENSARVGNDLRPQIQHAQHMIKEKEHQDINHCIKGPYQGETDKSDKRMFKHVCEHSPAFACEHLPVLDNLLNFPYSAQHRADDFLSRRKSFRYTRQGFQESAK
jgi:hypothetical protein